MCEYLPLTDCCQRKTRRLTWPCFCSRYQVCACYTRRIAFRPQAGRMGWRSHFHFCRYYTALNLGFTNEEEEKAAAAAALAAAATEAQAAPAPEPALAPVPALPTEAPAVEAKPEEPKVHTLIRVQTHFKDIDIHLLQRTRSCFL